jgi:hypothetical protein
VKLIRRRHMCIDCRERRSVFHFNGYVYADADHTLCPRCYRALRNSTRRHC